MTALRSEETRTLDLYVSICHSQLMAASVAGDAVANAAARTDNLVTDNLVTDGTTTACDRAMLWWIVVALQQVTFCWSPGCCHQGLILKFSAAAMSSRRPKTPFCM
jgi:hypothetical protein